MRSLRWKEKVMGWVTTRISQTTNFLAIRKSWFGDGGEPVSTELAQSRANVCLTCPMNYKGDWLWNMATQLAINAQSKLRNMMNIRLEGEEDLGVCEVCGCKPKLKCLVPIEHIKRHSSKEQLAKYPAHCWIRKEIKPTT
jgi:hypothetical protein